MVGAIMKLEMIIISMNYKIQHDRDYLITIFHFINPTIGMVRRQSLAQECSHLFYKLIFTIRKAYLTMQHFPKKHRRQQEGGLSPGYWTMFWSSEWVETVWRRKLKVLRRRRRLFLRLPIGRGIQISGSCWGCSYLIHLNINDIVNYQQILSTFLAYLKSTYNVTLHIGIGFIERFRSYKM